MNKKQKIKEFNVCALCNKNYTNYRGNELLLKESKCCYTCNCIVKDMLTPIKCYINKK